MGEGGCGGGADEEKEEEEDEEEQKNLRLWGPLKRPVQVKIADLGNACWVVSQNSRDFCSL